MKSPKFLPLACAALALQLISDAKAGATLSLHWDIDPTTAQISGTPYLGTNNLVRGMAFNPVREQLVVASRVFTPARICVIDASDGGSSHTLDSTDITTSSSIPASAFFALNQVVCDDAGVVYACNMILPAASNTAPIPFKIYRWENTNVGAAPTIAFDGDPAGTIPGPNPGDPPTTRANIRWGDSMTIRGSGANTQIAIGSGSTSVCIFTTTDGLTFTPHYFENVTATSFCRGIAFGAGNTLWTKSNGTSILRRTAFNLTNNTSSTLSSATISQGAGTQIVPLALDLTRNVLGTFETGGSGVDRARLYDITNPAVSPVALHEIALPRDNANSNAAGAAAFGKVGGEEFLFIANTNQGVQSYKITYDQTPVPPTITEQPTSRTAYVRGIAVTFSTAAVGFPTVFTYQWFKTGSDNVETPIPGAQSSVLTIAPVTTADAGSYRCKVSNSAGEVFTNPATLTLLTGPNTSVMTECWHLAPGSRPYLDSTSNAQRGMDFNPTSNRLYLASRWPNNTVRVLNAATGAELHALDLSALPALGGGYAATFPLNMIAVADDGAVFATNLSNVATNSSGVPIAPYGGHFRIFRWADDNPTTILTEVYNGNPFDDDFNDIGNRCGDTIDVRGSGLSTQILIGARDNRKFAIFTTTDGVFFSPTVYTAPAALPTSAFGLGIAFGSGNTVWGKGQGNALFYLSFDPATTSVALIKSFAGANFGDSIGPIGVDPVHGWIGGIAADISRNVRVYDLPIPFPDPAPTSLTWLDQEFTSTDFANSNGTGAVAVAGNKLFALTTNNGLYCYDLLRPAKPEFTLVSHDPNTSQITLRLKGRANANYLIQRSPDMAAGSWQNDGTETLPASGVLDFTRPGSGPKLFFRAVEQ